MLNLTEMDCHVNTTGSNVADFSGCRRSQDTLTTPSPHCTEGSDKQPKRKQDHSLN
jgi:hypothetical protein